MRNACRECPFRDRDAHSIKRMIDHLLNEYGRSGENHNCHMLIESIEDKEDPEKYCVGWREFKRLDNEPGGCPEEINFNVSPEFRHLDFQFPDEGERFPL